MGHDHAHGAGSNRARLAIALAIVAVVLVAEVVGAVLSGSLALLADAGHMASDAIGLTVALIATVVAARPATDRHTFGFQRVHEADRTARRDGFDQELREHRDHARVRRQRPDLDGFSFARGQRHRCKAPTSR